MQAPGDDERAISIQFIQWAAKTRQRILINAGNGVSILQHQIYGSYCTRDYRKALQQKLPLCCTAIVPYKDLPQGVATHVATKLLPLGCTKFGGKLP
jgi:hypothetical protein